MDLMKKMKKQIDKLMKYLSINFSRTQVSHGKVGLNQLISTNLVFIGPAQNHRSGNQKYIIATKFVILEGPNIMQNTFIYIDIQHLF